MPTLAEATVDLVAAHTHRLRCDGCHRFVGSQGAETVDCTRCGVRYVRLPDGLYTRSAL